MNQTKTFPAFMIAASLVMLSLVACGDRDPYDVRLKALERNQKTLPIAVAWPLEERASKITIVNGVKLAAQQINAEGGVLGRQIEVSTHDDGRSISKGFRLAMELAEDPSLFAVIGHLDSYISVPTSTVYDVAGLITMNPGSTDRALTQQGNQHLFRLLATNEQQGEKLARHFKARGYKRVVVYYVNNSYGLALANSLENEAVKLDIAIVDRRSYDKASREHSRTMEDWGKFYEFDALFLAGSMPEGATIIRAARENGIDQPIYGGDGLDSQQLVELGGDAVENTFVVSFFSSQIQQPAVQKFVAEYTKAFGSVPTEASAALGYDAVRLLAEAIAASGSLDRGKVTAKLRALDNWQGATGAYRFDEYGDVIDKPLVLNRIENGRFVLDGLIR